MKQLLFAAAVAILCCCMSCNNETKTSASNSQGEKNLQAMHMVSEAIKTGDMSKLGDVIAPDMIDHGGMMGDIKGLDSLKKEFAQMRAGSTDMNFAVIKEVADSEYAFQWVRYSGTAANASMGVPAGSKYNMTAVEIARFKDGKAVEHWTYLEPHEMEKMMHSSASMPKEMITDTAKMK